MVSEVTSVCYNNVKSFVKKKLCATADAGAFDNKSAKGATTTTGSIIV